MIYADYDFYASEYKGNMLAREDFERLAIRASTYIDKMIKGRGALDPLSFNVKMACCAVAEAWKTNETGEITSQSVGSWSKHYAKNTKSDADRLHEALSLYLGDLATRMRWV